MQLRTSLITDSHALEALVPAWSALLADSATNEPTLSPEWMLTWWEIYCHSRRLRVWSCTSQTGELLGLAPLHRRRHWYRPGIPFRRLEPLASGEREVDAICSDYLNVLARNGHESDVARQFAHDLRRGVLGGWDELVIPLMAGDGLMPNRLTEACRDAGLQAELTQTTTAPYIPLPSTWDDYLKALDRKDRYLINRTLRDFESWTGGDHVFQRAGSVADIEEGNRILRSLHHERWQGTEGGTFRSPLFLTFHDRVMPKLLQIGALELIWLTVRSEPVAAMYSMRWNRKTHFYQCGRRLDVPKNIRPGGVLLYHAIRTAIESGLREFDFLGGEAVYKSQLALASRPIVELRVTRGSLVETLRQTLQRTKEWVRPWLRRSTSKGPQSSSGA